MRRLIRRGDSRGQTLVEFALILPIFILLLVGIFDFGRAIYAYNTISNASREAVRVAIVNQNTSVITNEAKNMAVGLGVTVTVRFLNADLSTGPPCSATIALGCVAEVKTTYNYAAATPIISSLVGTFNMSSTTRQPVEYAYVSP